MLLGLQASGVNVLFLPLTVISATLGLSQEANTTITVEPIVDSLNTTSVKNMLKNMRDDKVKRLNLPRTVVVKGFHSGVLTCVDFDVRCWGCELESTRLQLLHIQ